MTTEYVYLHPNATVEESFARIRKVGMDKETIYTCYVTQNRVLLGGGHGAADAPVQL